MENPTPFDLNASIRQWRKELAASPALRREDCDELEAHLLDSIAALQAKDLAPEEAFWVARRRLGGGEPLAREFAKVNPERGWLGRVLWMVAGYLGICLISSLARVLVNGLMLVPDLARQLAVALEWVGADAWTGSWIWSLGPLLGPVHSSLQVAVFVGLGWLAWRLGTQPAGWLTRWTARAVNRPMTMGGAIVLLLACASAAAGGSSVAMMKWMPIEGYAVLMKWHFFTGFVPWIVWPVVLAALLRRLARHNAACTSEPGR